jgi:hypothetical protein
MSLTIPDVRRLVERTHSGRPAWTATAEEAARLAGMSVACGWALDASAASRFTALLRRVRYGGRPSAYANCDRGILGHFHRPLLAVPELPWLGQGRLSPADER